MINIVILLRPSTCVIIYKYDDMFYDQSEWSGGPTWLACISGSQTFHEGKITNNNDLKLLHKPLVF